MKTVLFFSRRYPPSFGALCAMILDVIKAFVYCRFLLYNCERVIEQWPIQRLYCHDRELAPLEKHDTVFTSISDSEDPNHQDEQIVLCNGCHGHFESGVEAENNHLILGRQRWQVESLVPTSSPPPQRVCGPG